MVLKPNPNPAIPSSKPEETAPEGLTPFIVKYLPFDALLEEKILARPPVWPRPNDYTELAQQSTEDDGFWFFDETSIPESSRDLFEEVCEDGTRLFKYLLTRQPNKKRTKCLLRLSIVLVKLLVHQQENDLDYGSEINERIEEQWGFVKECMVRFCLAENVFTEKTLRGLAEIRFSMPLQAQFFAACERTYPEFPTAYNGYGKTYLKCEIEDPSTLEHELYYTSFLKPIVKKFSESGKDEDSRNRYSILSSDFSMVHPASPKDIESLIPTLRVTPQQEVSKIDSEKNKKGEKTHCLSDQSIVNAEQVDLCERSQLILQHYCTLYTLLKNWSNETDPGQGKANSQSRTDPPIDLSRRKCCVLQKAAFLLFVGTENMWERCLKHGSAGNFDEDEAEERIPKLKKWFLEMLVVALSVHLDGWRVYKDLYGD